MSFYDYNDLQAQMKRYLNRSNNIPIQVLGLKFPLQKRLILSYFSKVSVTSLTNVQL